MSLGFDRDELYEQRLMESARLTEPSSGKTVYGREALRLFANEVGEALREARKKKPILYYARALQKYDTAAEAGDLDYLKELYPDHRIRALKITSAGHAKRGLKYYHDKVEEADVLVVAPFRKNRVTAGVLSEVRHALKKKISVKRLYKGGISTIKAARGRKGAKNPAGEFGVLRSRKVK